MSHGHVVLLLPYTRQLFFSTAFPPFRDKLPPKKNLLPLFSRKRLYYFRTFFHHRIRFDWGHKWPRPDGAEIRHLGVGSKTNFRNGWKVVFYHSKKIRKCSFPTHLSATENRIVYILLKFWGKFPYQFWSFHGLNLRSVVPFCRVTVKTHWL